jgi:hypothetical protein
MTELTRHYLRTKERASAARLAEAKEMEPEQLEHEFNESATRFGSFTAEGQGFYEADPRVRDVDKNQKSDARTYGWAMAMIKAPVKVEGAPDLDFAYLDREIVPTRTRPAREFDSEDGASLRIDLLLADAATGRPIIGELKIATDKDPYTGLVQALAAAAQMLSAGQRRRLTEHSERPGLRERIAPLRLAGIEDESLLDVYVLLADFPDFGRDRFEQMKRAEVLARELESRRLCRGLGRIRILALSKDADGLVQATTELPYRPG